MPAKLQYPNLRRSLYATRSTMDWGRALPAVVKLLADQRAEVELPACPQRRSGEDHDITFNRALSYWTALDHVLRYQLGWTHPAQGLARWLDEGGGDIYPPLSLVRHVWAGDGYLPRYLAWRVQKTGDHLPSAWMGRIERLEQELDREGEPIGPWQLHLEEQTGGHVTGPESGPRPRLAWLHPFDPSGERAATPPLVGEPELLLMFRGSLETGWYGALQNALTPQVRVFNEEHGSCGRFHRSLTSGRWHTVLEQVHMWGVRPGSGALF